MSNENNRLIPDQMHSSFDFDELQNKLENDLRTELADLKLLEDQKAAIGDPDNLGKTVMNIVWAQFINQIGTTAGEEFIRENGNMKLDLSYNAHFQSADDFANGIFAEHNPNREIYKERYAKWDQNFQRQNGEIIFDKDRTGVGKQRLVKNARSPYDRGRPYGSKENHIDVDHIIPAAEMIRDPEMNAYMDLDQRVAFANNKINLQEIDSSWNQSKRDKATRDWLNNPNSKGKTPEQALDNMSPEDKAELIARDDAARKEMAVKKKELQQNAADEAKASRKDEALRVSGKALQAVLMALLAQLVRKIIGKLISWLKSQKRNFDTFISEMKTTILEFFTDVKRNLLTAGDTFMTAIASSVFGPIVRTVKSAWLIIKQAGTSVVEAIEYIKNPDNAKKPVGILALEVGKIVMTGLAAAGSLALSQAIEKALMAVPVFTVEIPLMGSLASIIGLFLGGTVCGILGALVLHLIDSIIIKTQMQEITLKQIFQGNQIISSQEKLLTVQSYNTTQSRNAVLSQMESRHTEVEKKIHEAIDSVFGQPLLPAGE